MAHTLGAGHYFVVVLSREDIKSQAFLMSVCCNNLILPRMFGVEMSPTALWSIELDNG